LQFYRAPRACCFLGFPETSCNRNDVNRKREPFTAWERVSGDPRVSPGVPSARKRLAPVATYGQVRFFHCRYIFGGRGREEGKREGGVGGRKEGWEMVDLRLASTNAPRHDESCLPATLGFSPPDVGYRHKQQSNGCCARVNLSFSVTERHLDTLDRYIPLE